MLPCDHLGPAYRGIDLRCGLPLGHVGSHSKDGYVWDRSVWDRSEPATSESFVKPATSEQETRPEMIEIGGGCVLVVTHADHADPRDPTGKRLTRDTVIRLLVPGGRWEYIHLPPNTREWLGSRLMTQPGQE